MPITEETSKFSKEELVAYLDHLHYEQLKKCDDDYLWMSNHYQLMIEEIAHAIGLEGEFTKDFGMNKIMEYIEERITISSGAMD